MTTHELLTRPITTPGLQPGAPPAPDRLSPAECRRRLAGQVVARLGFETGRGPRSVVVGYVLRGGDEVLLLLPEYHPAVGYLAGAPVRVEVEVETGSGWDVVRGTGTASVDPAESGVHPYGARWPPGVAVHEVRVRLTRLEGVRRTA